MATAPAFRFPSPDGCLVQELIVGYQHITGDPVHRPAKRNFIAACYRVHGDDFLPLVARLFARTGTAMNLLGEIRRLAPAASVPPDDEPPEDEPMERTGHAPEHPSVLAPNLIYGLGNRPSFDGTSKRRWDRHLSNPDAAGFFDQDEVEEPHRRSPTAEALGR